MINEYEDILYMEHHISKNHPQMSMENRAAQFSPFAALTGYDDEILEARRLTDSKAELDENRLEELDNKLAIIYENQGSRPLVEITYFLKDLRKEGGSYEKVKERIKKLDEYERKIVLENGMEINFDDVIDII